MAIQSFPRKVGSDTLLRKGDRLIVCSRTDMDEWQLQQTRKTVIQIAGEDWTLAGKQFTPAKEIHYLLEPWPKFTGEIPGRWIAYDESYVRARDEAARNTKIEILIGPVLYHGRAVTGFLPSKIKARIEKRFGISARSSTLISLVVELLAFFLIGAFLQVFAYASMHVPMLVFDIPAYIVLVPILLLDLIIRYGSYLRDDPSPLGVLEWIVRWKSIWQPS